MRSLNKKLYRDIKFNKSQFITIFLMIFLGVFVFSGIHSYMDGMRISGENYYEENNFEDLFLVGENFTKEDLENIKKIENIKDAERKFTIVTTLLDHDDVTLETNFIESNHISKFYIVEGEAFSREKDGVWIDSYLAKNLGLTVGEKITFQYKNYEMTKKILGLITVPDHVYAIKSENEIFPTHQDYGFVYLSIDQFPKNFIFDELRSKNALLRNLENQEIESLISDFHIEDYYIFNSVMIDVDDVSKLEDTKEDIESNISSAIAVTDRNSNISYNSYNSEVEEGDTYSSVFTLLFLFIAVLSVVTTMNRFVRGQRTQIGTLKALGIKRNKIILHYISYGFYISLVASILGVVLGNFTLGQFFLNMEMTYFEVPIYSTKLLPIVYVLAIGVVLVVTLVTYLSCKKILKEPASLALRVEVPKVKSTNFDITTKEIFKKLSLSSRWNLRDITRNKGRTLMAIVGIVGCTMLIVCAFGLLDSMNSYLDWEFEKLSNFRYKLSLNENYTEEEFELLKQKYGDQTSKTYGIEIKTGGNKETNVLTINDALNKLRYTDHNKEYMELSDDGIYITEKLSKTLGLTVGDEITWHIFGDDNWYTSKIVGLNRDPQNQQLNATRKFYESLGLNYRADCIYTDEDLSDVEILDGVDTIQSINNLKEGMEGMLDTMKSMVVLLIVVSAILGFVIIYNLGILSFSEKNYQFATLKVLGFKNQYIKKIFVKQNIWITILAIAIGLPLGFLMTDYIFKSALSDSYDFNANIKLISYVYSIIGTFVVSFIVNKILSGKIKTIDMVTSLKGNE
ncbi:MAG: FtsX-like permease family protein [Clostridia bacterium]|nr:FtsX-like permease family protein [Clostridia bacterium]